MNRFPKEENRGREGGGEKTNCLYFVFSIWIAKPAFNSDTAERKKKRGEKEGKGPYPFLQIPYLFLYLYNQKYNFPSRAQSA